MGSCFAGEIRNALKRRGFTVYPDYPAIPFDQSSVRVDDLPQDKLMEHYDTFVMRQEFEEVFGLWPDRCAGAWEVRDTNINEYFRSEIAYQEPGRRRVFGKSVALLEEVSERITAAVRIGIERSELIVLTLGLTEIWRNNKTGRYVCCAVEDKWGIGRGRATFHQSTFIENYANVKAILDLLFAHFPDKRVLLTVSPVPLLRTFSDMDVGTANLESKSILRAVAGQICREYPANVTYFPSYEMATIINVPVYQEDGRHVLPSFADLVVNAFAMAHLESA